MLFKDLKSIIKEADEAAAPAPAPETPATADAQPLDTKLKANKPQKATQNVKQASDGIGKESYKISTKLETKLKMTLTSMLNIQSIKVSNNSVKIVFDFSKGKDKFIMKETGSEISQEDAIAFIQMEIMAGLGSKGDEIDLDSKYLGGMLLITVKSTLETSKD